MIRIIRRSSDTPNVANIDDTRMVRYAYGFNGIVKGYGGELAMKYDSLSESIHISSGIVVVQGWEIEITEVSLSLYDLIEHTNSYGYIILSVNLLAELSVIGISYADSLYESEFVPPLPDLTQSPRGSARYILGRFSVTSEGTVKDFVRTASLIPYLPEYFNSKLPELRGHNTGFTYTNYSHTVNANAFPAQEGYYYIEDTAEAQNFPTPFVGGFLHIKKSSVDSYGYCTLMQEFTSKSGKVYIRTATLESSEDFPTRFSDWSLVGYQYYSKLDYLIGSNSMVIMVSLDVSEYGWESSGVRDGTYSSFVSNFKKYVPEGVMAPITTSREGFVGYMYWVSWEGDPLVYTTNGDIVLENFLQEVVGSDPIVKRSVRKVY